MKNCFFEFINNLLEKKSTYLYVLIFVFATIVVYSAIQPNFHLEIKCSTSILADANILSNTTTIEYIPTVQDLFTDKFGNPSPPVSPSLGVGYVVDDESPYSFYLESPCVWYEIHAKDLNGYIPPEHLIIKRWIVDTAVAAWNSDGEKSTLPEHTAKIIGIYADDTDDYPFLFGIGVNNDSINLDPPRIKAILFSDFFNGKPIDYARKRTNYLVQVYLIGGDIPMIEKSYKIQIEAKWNYSTSTIDHISSFFVEDANWSINDLNIDNWTKP